MLKQMKQTNIRDSSMQCIFKGKKEQIKKCKKALLLADGNFGVNIEHLDVRKAGLFHYNLEFTLKGEKKQLKRFLQRIESNYQILNGNILGFIDYYV